MLYGRTGETGRIEALLEGARQGRSGSLVIRGDPGIGKSALLDFAAEAARTTENATVARSAEAAEPARTTGGLRVLRCDGVESEAELAYAGLQIVLRPGLGLMDVLPPPQGAALRSALGLASGPIADRFLIGLATLSLLSELAEDGPLLCLIDDAHWLDHASATALLFAARRLDAEGIVMLFAARDGFEAAGLEEMRLTGLDRTAAEALMDAHGAPLSGAVRDRILLEAAGNPLALRELPALVDGHTFSATPLPLPQRLRDAYARQIGRLPESAQTLLLLAAAEEGGDVGTVLRAAGTLGVTEAAVGIAERSGLISVRIPTIAFRHPVIRSATYQRATFGQRRAAHLALASVLVAEEDAHRRAWHLATAATEPDEEIAAELERTVLRAGKRQSHAAVAIALERSASLTPDPGERARRTIVAAETSWFAGLTETALALADRAAQLTGDPRNVARIAGIRALVVHDRGETHNAYEILMAATESIAAAAPVAAARLVGQAILMVWYDDPFRVERAVSRLIALTSPGAPAAPPAPPAVAAMVESLSGALDRLEPLLGTDADGSYAMFFTLLRAHLRGEFDRAREMASAAAGQCRAVGLIGLLPLVNTAISGTEVVLNRFRDAAATASEGLKLAVDIDQPRHAAQMQAILAWVRAVEGDERRCRELAGAALRFAVDTDNPSIVNWATWALAMLDLGYGRYEKASQRLEATVHAQGQHLMGVLLLAPDRVEAAVRMGRPDRAAGALATFAEWAAVTSPSPRMAAVLHRCQAIAGSAEAATEEHFAAALTLHAIDGSPFEQARTELLYGEWLRRARRKAAARGVLRTALEHFEQAGATPWAERTRAELRATGERSRPRAAATPLGRLTPQELQVVRLAATGATNREIAAMLFLSPRTISHHLYNAFPKLGVTNRTELARLNLTDDH